METLSELLVICAGNSPVPCEFPAQRPVTRSFNVFFDLRLSKRLSKQSWGWWFETPWRPLWRHRNGMIWHQMRKKLTMANNRTLGHITQHNLSDYCSGSLEPESSCHDRDWIMELPMEADILTFTGILTPEDASVASCFPFDITISLSWFPLLSMPPLHSAIP